MSKTPAVVLACLAVLPATVPAQAPPPPYLPGGPVAQPLTLEGAVSLALRHDPAVAQARAVKAFNLGLLQEQRGAFDDVVTASASLARETMPIPTGVLNNDAGRKRLLRALATTFEGLANSIQQQLDSGIFGPLPDCIETTLTIGTTVTEIHCLPPTVFIDLDAILRGSQDAGLDEAVQAVRDAWRRQLETYLATSRFIAYVGRQLLRQQGVTPTIEDRDTLSYSLGLAKLYRNGIFFQPKVDFSAVRDTWRGKPLDPTFGGKGVLVAYRSQFGFELDVPLGRGGGIVSAQAGERAAAKQLEAATFQEAAALQSAALRTTLAYYNAAAAKARVELLAATVARERQLGEVAQALVAAEELPRADLTLLEARLDQSEANLARARQAFLQARTELLTHMGVAAAGPQELPELAEGLPEAPAEGVLARLEEEVEGDLGR
ncbi:MAG: TolC family protein, partial [Thermoanaerobaculaceae bacterium]|nr:TolC family protein [Thermoanaerobaculaceae bacterium]